MSNDNCLGCGSTDLFIFSDFQFLPRLTSDSRPFSAGGTLRVCNACSLIQKHANNDWLEEIKRIYEAYAAYWQADGDEQIVFDSEAGIVRRRSEVLLDYLYEALPPPKGGRALDIGCASGATLRALSARLRNWALFGHDLDDRNQEKLSSIAGFERLFVGDIANIEGVYDQISLIHVLEHFADPQKTLASLRELLSPSGRILVELPNIMENPFDILIADHVAHFSPLALQKLVEKAGFTGILCETSWIRKEITLVAVVSDDAPTRHASYADNAAALQARQVVQNSIVWLRNLIEAAKERAKTSKRFGLFGTSLAATWLASNIGDTVDFFVDEDPSRIGGEFLGRPVLAPCEVSESDTVFLALVPKIANGIYCRLPNRKGNWILPPAVNTT